MNSFFKKIAIGSAALALTTTIFASSAFAAESSTTVTGDAMTLSNVADSPFAGVTLNGQTQTITAPLSTFDVTDPRGTGAGWNVTVSASEFSQKDGAGEVTTSLSAGSLNLAAPAVTKNDDNSSDLNTITAAGGLIDSAPVKVLSAAVDGGMGSYNVAASNMTLTLQPKEVYAGTYESTITVELTTGP